MNIIFLFIKSVILMLLKNKFTYLIFVSQIASLNNSVEGHAHDLTSRYCGTAMDVGTNIMGASAVSSSSKSVIVQRDGISLISPATYISNEQLITSISSLPDSGQFCFEATNAKFSSSTGGSCTNYVRTTKNNAIIIMPNDGSVVSIKVGWAEKEGAVSISSSFILNPSNDTSSPTVTTTKSPSSLPSTHSAYSSASQLYYNVHLTYILNGITATECENKAKVAMRTLITGDTVMNQENVIITSCTSITSSRRNLVESESTPHAMLSSTSTGVSVNLLLIGFSNYTIANEKLLKCYNYISNNLGPQLVNLTSLSIGTVTVTSQSVLSDSDTYSQSCSLSPTMSMSWYTKSDHSGVRVSVTNTATSSSWLAAGIVKYDDSMVPSSGSYNSVYLYAPNSGKAGLFTLESYSSSGIIADTRTRTSSDIVWLRGSAGETSMTFDRASSTGVTDDPILDLSGWNYVIWAHGGLWPYIHGRSGFVLVNWSKGICTNTATEIPLHPMLIFIIPFIVAIFNVLPIRNTALMKLLNRKIILSAHWGLSISSVIMIVLYLLLWLAIAGRAYMYLIRIGSSEARALHLAVGYLAMMNLWMSMLPNSKSRIFHYIVGKASFERSIKVHSLLTSSGLILAAIHFILASYTRGHLFDNKTPFITYGIVAFFTMLFMSTLAFEPIRRWQYGLFLNVHNLYIIVIIFLSLHSDKAFYGFIFGLLLQGWNSSRKLYRYCNPVSLSLPAAANPTAHAQNITVHNVGDSQRIISITVCFPANNFPINIGDYFFLNLREVSLTSWHPFSVAGYDESKKEVTFFIRVNNKPHTWTHRLYAIVSSDNRCNTGKELKISLDGPFGFVSGSPASHSGVLLFAGGIGITPFLTAIQYLSVAVATAKLTTMTTTTTCIKLVWVIREIALFDIFAPKLASLATLCSDIDFQISLFVTSVDYQKVDETAAASLPIIISRGRPDIHQITTDFAGSLDDRNSLFMLVCGPHQLANRVAAVATSLNIDYHREVFEY